MTKLYNLYKQLKSLGVWRYVIAAAGLLLGILKIVEGILNRRRAIQDANSTDDRPVPIGVPDKEGIKQIPATGASGSDKKPEGVTPTHHVTVTGTGTLQPDNDETVNKADSILDTIRKYM